MSFSSNEEQQAVLKVYEAWKSRQTMAQIHNLASSNPTLANKSIRIQERVSSDSGTNWTVVFDQTINLPDVNPVTPVTPIPPPPPPPPPPGQQHQIIVGAMVDASGNEQLTDSMIKDFNNLSKKPIGISYFTHHWFKTVEPFPKSMCDTAKSNNTIPYIRMNADELKSTVVNCAAIISGKYDKELTQYANDAKAWGSTIFAEIGTEVNGNFLAFSGEGSTAYKTMARKVITLFKGIAPNVKFVFHGDYNDLSSHPEQWYPGDDLVEYIGSSMYGQSNGKGCIGSLEANNNAAYIAMRKTGKKPLAILEWGLGTVDDITNTLRDLPNKFPDIKMLLYWNEKGDYDRRIDKTADSLKAYQQGISNAVYVSSIVPVTPVPEPPGPVTPVPPAPAPAPAPTSGNIGPDGVLQIFPDKTGESQVYIMDDPPKDKFNVSYGGGSHLPYTKKVENGLTFFNTTGSPIKYNSGAAPGRSVRLDMYPDGGMWGNKTPYSWENNPGYLYTPKGIQNGEYTLYVRPEGALGTHQSLAWKLGGRDEDDKRSLFEICAADATHKDPYCHWDFLHFPYIACPTKVLSGHGKMIDNKWYGLKAVRIVDPGKKFCDFYLFEDTNPFDGNGKPLNNWRLIAHAHDAGCSGYKMIPTTWRSHKDLCRIDGFQSVSFCKMSIREIDTSAKPVIPLSLAMMAAATAEPMAIVEGEPERVDPDDKSKWTINPDMSVEEAQAMGAKTGPF